MAFGGMSARSLGQGQTAEADLNHDGKDHLIRYRITKTDVGQEGDV